MATVKSIDVNCISRNGAGCGGRLVGLTIDQIASAWLDGDSVTTIKYVPGDDVHASNTPVIYKVQETLGDIIIKADGADSDNGLVIVTVTKANGSTLRTPKTEIINRTKIISMVLIYDDNDQIAGTRIVYGNWYRSVIQVEENLVTETSSVS